MLLCQVKPIDTNPKSEDRGLQTPNTKVNKPLLGKLETLKEMLLGKAQRNHSLSEKLVDIYARANV